MREIKFRAWDYNNECIIPWEKINLEKDEGENTFSVVVFDEDVGDHFDDFPYMQYTGLKDKNDVEIYEGDILDGVRKESVVVSYSRGAFGFTFLARNSFHTDEKVPVFRFLGEVDINSLKIIGNIYENPELLEVAE